MFEVLNSYLFQHKNISIPGLGTIYLETLPATTDQVGKTILPPMYHFRFDKYFDAPDKEFFSFLASEKNIPDYEAIKWYNEFSYELRNKIRQEDKVKWDGIGILKKDYSGNIVFESEPESSLYMRPVSAEPVMRKNTQHRMVVGDKERTNYEMDQWLNADPSNQKKQTWWVYALVGACAATLILLFHYSRARFLNTSTGNQQKVEITK